MQYTVIPILINPAAHSASAHGHAACALPPPYRPRFSSTRLQADATPFCIIHYTDHGVSIALGRDQGATDGQGARFCTKA